MCWRKIWPQLQWETFKIIEIIFPFRKKPPLSLTFTSWVNSEWMGFFFFFCFCFQNEQFCSSSSRFSGIIGNLREIGWTSPGAHGVYSWAVSNHTGNQCPFLVQFYILEVQDAKHPRTDGWRPTVERKGKSGREGRQCVFKVNCTHRWSLRWAVNWNTWELRPTNQSTLNKYKNPKRLRLRKQERNMSPVRLWKLKKKTSTHSTCGSQNDLWILR